MASIFGRKMLAFKDVAEVAAAGGTSNFSSSTICVDGAVYRTGKRVVEAGPAATAVELALRSEKWGITTATYKSAFFVVIYVFTCVRRFSAFVDNDTSFFRCEIVEFHCSQFTPRPF